MPPVASTPTIIDAQRAHKELQETITRLKVQHEISVRAHEEVLHATELLRDEQSIIRETVRIEQENALKILKEIESLIDQSFSTLSYAGQITDQTTEFISRLQDEIAREKKAIEIARAKQEVIHTDIINEEKILLSKKRSLEIYEKRLNDQIAEHGLSEAIKIQI